MATPTPTSTPTETSRDERRRKIMARGTDRMALITGRPPPLSSPYDNHQTEGGPDAVLGDTCSGSRSSRDDAANEVVRGKHSDHAAEHRQRAEASLSDRKTPEIVELGTQKRPTTTTRSSDRVSGRGSCSSSTPPWRCIQPWFFSSKRLNSCVLESEKARACCAFAIAVLAVMTHNAWSLVTSRPLYLLLVTDVTIVLVRMYADAQRKEPEESKTEERVEPPEDGDNWGGAVKVLERGLAVYQTFRGVFIDCSIYMVIVICSLSIV